MRPLPRSREATLIKYSTALGACHEGAAIEGLCLTGETLNDTASSYTTFYHNLSAYANDPSGAPDVSGVLSWNLRVAGNQTVPSALRFSFDPTSNVVIPVFFPDDQEYQLVDFDSSNSLYIPRGLDDCQSPPTYIDPPQKLKNWYICLTRYGYLYYTLSWKIGATGMPQNPSCQEVEVFRIWN